jgi:histone H3/H4
MRLIELGVTSKTAYRRCAPEGPWQRLLPGILSLYKGPPTREQLITAALLYAGPDALITGYEACRAHKLQNVPVEDKSVHPLLPHDRRVHNFDYVIMERTHRMPAKIEKQGLPVAPINRAVLDASRRMRELAPAQALLSESVQRSFTSVERLSAELAAGSQRGSAIPRRVLDQLMPGAQSVAEIGAVDVWSRSGLPPPLWNTKLIDARGEHIATPDAWFDDVGLAWEIDSLAFHAGFQGFTTTLARNSRYTASAVLVLQTLPSRLKTEPAKVIEELRAAYLAASARPRPSVSWVA